MKKYYAHKDHPNRIFFGQYYMVKDGRFWYSVNKDGSPKSKDFSYKARLNFNRYVKNGIWVEVFPNFALDESKKCPYCGGTI